MSKYNHFILFYGYKEKENHVIIMSDLDIYNFIHNRF